MNTEVTAYINSAPIEQQQIMETIRKLIHDNLPHVSEQFKWSRPVFRTNKDFAYFKMAKAYVTLGFFNFEKLIDNDNRLEGTGKDMRHIKLKTLSEPDKKLLVEWIKASAS